MSNKEIRPHGSWNSPISSGLIVSGSIGLGEIQLDNEFVYWLEMRPEEKGRYVVVRHSAKNGFEDISAADINARTRVHEYGGGSYLVHGNRLFVTQFSDQRLYEQVIGAEPRPLTAQGEDRRFADFILDESRSRLISVMEHHVHGEKEARNSLVAVASGSADHEIGILAGGADFYSNPRLSPDGSRLCWMRPRLRFRSRPWRRSPTSGRPRREAASRRCHPINGVPMWTRSRRRSVMP